MKLINIILSAVLALGSGCVGGVTYSPPSGPTGRALTEQRESEHYVYHFAPGDTVDSAWQESYHAWLTAALQVSASGKIHYYKYKDRAHLMEITGKNTNGFAERLLFHVIFPTDNHESVHALVLDRMGHPAALFGEGIAVAHSTDPVNGKLFPIWNSESAHVIATRFRRNGQLPGLDQLLESNGFRQMDAHITYPVAGSFVRFLIDRHGLPPLKELFATVGYTDAASAIRQHFQASYGFPIETVWSDWLAFLDAQP